MKHLQQPWTQPYNNINLNSNLNSVAAKTKLAKLIKGYEMLISMHKLMNAKIFNFQNKLAHHMLVLAMACVPSISNSSVAFFIPLILASYFTKVGNSFNAKDLSCILPSRITLSNTI